MLQAYVSSVSGVSDVCLRVSSECCICYYGSIRIFQAYLSSVSHISDSCYKCFTWMMLLWIYMYVSSICCKCFICFRRMLQVFHLDVSKVDLGEHMFHLPQPPYSCWGTAVGHRASARGRQTPPRLTSASGAGGSDPCGPRDERGAWDGLLEHGIGAGAACGCGGTNAE
jgi:hypothetical protein